MKSQRWAPPKKFWVDESKRWAPPKKIWVDESKRWEPLWVDRVYDRKTPKNAKFV